MIVFNLDDTLANLDHRRYFLDREKTHPDYYREPCEHCSLDDPHEYHTQLHKATQLPWAPDWESYDNACDLDEPIIPAKTMLKHFTMTGWKIEIWTGRSESVREKTIEWIFQKIWNGNPVMRRRAAYTVKMRPIGCIDSEVELKARWIRELRETDKKVSFAFETYQAACEIWTRHRIPCFQLWMYADEDIMPNPEEQGTQACSQPL